METIGKKALPTNPQNVYSLPGTVLGSGVRLCARPFSAIRKLMVQGQGDQTS